MKEIKLLIFFVCLFCVVFVNAQNLEFIPVEHASFIIKSKNSIVFVDPVGEKEKYSNLTPDLIIITHKHHDHLDKNLLENIVGESTKVIAPASVEAEVSFVEVLDNGETIKVKGIKVEAVLMYNVTEERKKYHSKGDGNGYILTVDKQRVYVSGDTEDIPEMRGLKDIDYAFICMNLPYTMTVEQAISATLAFKPKVAYPYHYRAIGGKSDVYKYKNEVEKNAFTKVILLNWYK